MKLVVSTSGTDLDAPVDARFGRAPYFLIVDPKSMEFEAVANTQNLQAAQGAGIQAAAHVARFKPAAVLTGHCGPKAYQTLKSAGIVVAVNVAGTAREAVQSYLNGECNLADGPDVTGHWS